jgi:hypothetical protein
LARVRFLLRLSVAVGILVSMTGIAGASADTGACTRFEAFAGSCPTPTIHAHTGKDGVTIRGDIDRPGSGGETHSNGSGADRVADPAVVDPDLVGSDIVVRDGYTVTEPVKLSDLVNFHPASGVDRMEPDGFIIVGLATNFYAQATMQVQSGDLLGRPATVRFTPVRYHWSYGDGTGATLSTPGMSWADQANSEFEPTATSHVYRSAGSYTIDLTIDYAAEYRYTSTEWTPIDGVVPVAANRLSVTAGAATTVLVNGDCTASRPGPGC